MAVDRIPAGVDFVAHLNRQLAPCNVLLAGLGPYERSGQFRGDRNRSRMRTDPEGRGGKGCCGIGVGRGHGGFSIGIH
jgi:hypothetical protein